LSYNNTTRSSQAERRRRAIIESATSAFLQHGYVDTTIRGVAEQAGVSQETIYKAFRNKAMLLKSAYDVTLAGDADPVPMSERPEVLAVRDAKTSADAAAAYARLARTISAHVGPLLRIIFDARGTDPDLDRFVEQVDAERFAGTTAVIRQWGTRGWIAHEPGVASGTDRARDILWTLISPSVYQLFKDRSWDDQAYETWLAQTISATVMTKSSQ
jgi:AcrR family transcriptional regulator